MIGYFKKSIRDLKKSHRGNSHSAPDQRSDNTPRTKMSKFLFERANHYITTHGALFSFSLSDLQRAMEEAMPGTIVR